MTGAALQRCRYRIEIYGSGNHGIALSLQIRIVNPNLVCCRPDMRALRGGQAPFNLWIAL
jgi:hypothetical protein